MGEGKRAKGIIIPNSICVGIGSVSDEDAGRLIKRAARWQLDDPAVAGENRAASGDAELDGVAGLLWSMLKKTLDENAEAYQRRCVINRRNAGGGEERESRESRAASDPDELELSGDTPPPSRRRRVAKISFDEEKGFVGITDELKNEWAERYKFVDVEEKLITLEKWAAKKDLSGRESLKATIVGILARDNKENERKGGEPWKKRSAPPVATTGMIGRVNDASKM